MTVSAHPYRGPAPPHAPAPPAAEAGVALDDVVVALLLLLVGGLGVLSGLSMDRQAQLSLGLVLIAFAIKVGWEARRSRPR
jgi:hypothetical protein